MHLIHASWVSWEHDLWVQNKKFSLLLQSGFMPYHVIIDCLVGVVGISTATNDNLHCHFCCTKLVSNNELSPVHTNYCPSAYFMASAKDQFRLIKMFSLIRLNMFQNEYLWKIYKLPGSKHFMKNSRCIHHWSIWYLLTKCMSINILEM